MAYDFGGWSCWDMDVDTVAVEVYDAHGWLIVDDYGIPCQVGSWIRMPDLDYGTYYVTLTAYDPWGYALFVADTPVDHFDLRTQLVVTLY